MRLCSFGRAVVDMANYHIGGEDGIIDDEWGFYNDIELLFRRDGWIDSGEADDLRSKIAELEQEVIDLENEITNLGRE